MAATVLVEKEDGVAIIRLNRPESMNALDLEAEQEFANAINEVNHDDTIRVVVITGTGKAFCAGADVKGMGEETVERVRKHLKDAQGIILALVNMEKPVIAAINGLAVGAGCSIALASDIIIASANAKFSQAFIKVGLVADMGGMHFLPRMVGLAKAKELMFTGVMVDAEEAHEIGMVNRVVPEGDLERAAKELAREIALAPREPIRLMKKILNQSASLDLPSLLQLETEAQEVCAQTDNHKKRVQAFLNRKSK